MLGATQSKRRVLVIDDEEDLRSILVHNLEREGYQVAGLETGATAMETVRGFAPDLLLLDLMLPEIGGVELCRRIRAEPLPRQPVIVMITARGEEIDRVVGFEVGADDYVVKPFSVRELVLRVNAHLRATKRSEETPTLLSGAAAVRPRRTFVVGPLTIDLDTHRVLLEGREVPASVLEVRLLAHLAEAGGSVCRRRDLLTKVWNYNPEVTSRTVDTHVKRLRDKLGPAGALIQTVRGIGYRLAPPARSL